MLEYFDIFSKKFQFWIEYLQFFNSVLGHVLRAKLRNGGRFQWFIGQLSFIYFFVEFQPQSQPQQNPGGPEAKSPFMNRTTSRNGGRGGNMMEMPPPLPAANAGKINFCQLI